jgi:hypothetical protein
VARAWLVPGYDRELVGQRRELRLPHATVLPGAMDEHEQRPTADALVRDLDPVRPNNLHRRNVPRAVQTAQLIEKQRRT